METGQWLIINEHVRIPAHEIRMRFVQGGGPGGQHVNKVATKVLLSLDVANSPSLSDEQRGRIMRKLASRLDKQGILTVSVQETRSQKQNREIATGRLISLLADALIIPKVRRKTRKPRAVEERRLENKRRQSSKKQGRSKKWVSD